MNYNYDEIYLIDQEFDCLDEVSFEQYEELLDEELYSYE